MDAEHPLIVAFLEHWQGRVDPALEEESSKRSLEQCLTELVAQAQKRWPRLTVQVADFIRYLAQRVPPDQPPSESLSKIKGDDLYLAFACLQGASEALTIFENEVFSDGFDHATRHLCKQPGQLEDIKQNLRLKLFWPSAKAAPKIEQYSGAGELRAWIGVVGLREVLASFRQSPKEVLAHKGDVVDILLDTAPSDDEELANLRQTYRDDFRAVFYQAVESLPPREKNMLRYYYVDGLNIDKIGVLYGVHRATVARQLARIRQTLLTQTQQLLMARLQITPNTVNSIIRLVESNLELSLSRVLSPSEPKARESE